MPIETATLIDKLLQDDDDDLEQPARIYTCRCLLILVFMIVMMTSIMFLIILYN
jgi:hypothetical protein